MKARIFWIDIVKFIAVLFVILAHIVWIVEQEIHIKGNLLNDFLTINRIIATLGVPLFMLVSGSLLLGKEFKSNSDIFAFYKRGLLPSIYNCRDLDCYILLSNDSPFFIERNAALYGFCSQARSSSMVCQVDSNLLSVDSIPESFKKQADFCIYIFINSYCSLYLYL